MDISSHQEIAIARMGDWVHCDTPLVHYDKEDDSYDLYHPDEGRGRSTCSRSSSRVQSWSKNKWAPPQRPPPVQWQQEYDDGRGYYEEGQEDYYSARRGNDGYGIVCIGMMGMMGIAPICLSLRLIVVRVLQERASRRRKKLYNSIFIYI